MCLACNSKIVTPSRRSVLLGGLAALSVSDLPAFAQEAAAVSPDEALQRLVDGNARYVAGQRANTDFSAGRAARALTQRPFAAILSCADSRVSPELAFDQGPGDLFVVRVAGNFVNDDGLASLLLILLSLQFIFAVFLKLCNVCLSGKGFVFVQLAAGNHVFIDLFPIEFFEGFL